MVGKYLAGVVALVVATTACAVEIEGVRLDDKANVGGQDLVLNGAGVRKRAIFKVYVGSLYVPAKSRSLQEVLANGPRRVQLNLLRSLSADQLIGAVQDGLKQNLAPAEMETVVIPMGELAAIMKSFGEAKEGSVVTLDFVDGGTKISLNGTERGMIQGAAFNEALMRIWIGEHPAQADLKKAMLGGA
jgi:chalcone isomerase-like protein